MNRMRVGLIGSATAMHAAGARAQAGVAFAATLACGVPIAAGAQDYPVKPVRIVTAQAGGGTDFTARLVAQGLSARIGKQFVVDNRAGVVICGEHVAHAAPDGYTLLMFGSSLWLAPYMRSSVPFDAVRDFAPIGLAVNSPILIVVHPTLPVKSVRELIALARARPGALDYATGQSGASSHLASELFKSMAGIDMMRIPYKGNGPAVSALIGGQVQLMFPTAGSVVTHITSGRVRALAVTSARPSPLLPDLPTVAAAGLPGFEADAIVAAFAPARTPPAIVARLSREMNAALNQPEIRQRFAASGVEVVGSSPQDLAAVMQAEMRRLGRLIKDLGIRED